MVLLDPNEPQGNDDPPVFQVEVLLPDLELRQLAPGQQLAVVETYRISSAQ